MITIKQLQFSYRGASQPSLVDVELSVASQKLFGLLGPNGAGKTTILSILSGLLPCPTNTVFIDGCDIASRNKRQWKSQLSLVPQEYAFYNPLTVEENLRFFGGVQGLNTPTLKSRIEEVVKITSLKDRLHYRAATLSGGLKRRLNLAIGLLNRPRLLLLDEPTVGIDPHSRYFILETIKHLNQQGTTVIYTSHYMEEVEALCDQIAIIDRGQVLLQGSLQQLLQNEGSRILSIDLSEPLTAPQREALHQTLSFSPFTLDQNQQRLDIQIGADGDIVAALEKLKQQQLTVGRIHYGARNLEDLFLNLTQRSLRD